MTTIIIIAGLILVLILVILSKITSSDKFIRAYCLSLFQQRQRLFLSNITKDSRLYNHSSEEKSFEAMVEVLQDELWKKSKDLDDNISKKIFNLDLVIDIAYVAWLIYFVHKNYDVSKSSQTD